MSTLPTRLFRTRLHPAFPALVLVAAGAALSWTASGTVRNSAGTPLQGVAVSTPDPGGVGTTTSASGDFSLASTTGIQLGPARAAWDVRFAEGDLLLRTPVDGPLELSLVDSRGKTLWSASTEARNGSARTRAPQGFRNLAAVLRIRGLSSGIDAALVVDPDGARVARHIVAPRAMASLPSLRFSKSGYRDTSVALASEATSGLVVTLRDTGTTTVACPAAKLAAGDQTRTLTVGGVARTYILHVPAAYTGSTPTPLLVDYHPIGGTASGQSGSSPYKAKTDPEGVISAYPNGLQSPNMGQAWNVQGCCTTANDTGFARAMVADIRKVACIDPKRVYAAGFSMGGGMTHFSACHLADLFAAGAPAAFDLLQQNVTACKPSRPLTMILFRSTGDGVVPYAGGHSAVVTGMAIDFLGARGSFQKWAELDKCTGSPSAEDASGCSTYSNCAGGVQVTLCTKQGGGHDYGNATVGWPLLKKYTLP